MQPLLSSGETSRANGSLHVSAATWSVIGLLSLLIVTVHRILRHCGRLPPLEDTFMIGGGDLIEVLERCAVVGTLVDAPNALETPSPQESSPCFRCARRRGAATAVRTAQGNALLDEELPSFLNPAPLTEPPSSLSNSPTVITPPESLTEVGEVCAAGKSMNALVSWLSLLPLRLRNCLCTWVSSHQWLSGMFTVYRILHMDYSFAIQRREELKEDKGAAADYTVASRQRHGDNVWDGVPGSENENAHSRLRLFLWTHLYAPQERPTQHRRNAAGADALPPGHAQSAFNSQSSTTSEEEERNAFLAMTVSTGIPTTTYSPFSVGKPLLCCGLPLGFGLHGEPPLMWEESLGTPIPVALRGGDGERYDAHLDTVVVER